MDRFLDFIKANKCLEGRDISIVELGTADYGIKSNQAFNKGDLLFEIARKLIITVQDARDSPLSNFLLTEQFFLSMPNVSLALYVLFLKLSAETTSSELQPYLDILPPTFHTPIHFSLNELKSLQTSQCFGNTFVVCHTSLTKNEILVSYFVIYLKQRRHFDSHS